MSEMICTLVGMASLIAIPIAAFAYQFRERTRWQLKDEGSSPVSDQVRAHIAKLPDEAALDALRPHIASAGFNQCVETVSRGHRRADERYCEGFLIDAHGETYTIGRERDGTAAGTRLEEAMRRLAAQLGVEFYRM